MRYVKNRVDLLGLYINAFIHIAAQNEKDLYKENLLDLLELVDERLIRDYAISILSRNKDIHKQLLIFLDFYYYSDDRIEYYFLTQNAPVLEKMFEENSLMDVCNEIFDIYYFYKEECCEREDFIDKENE